MEPQNSAWPWCLLTWTLIGRHAVVPRTGGVARFSPLFNRHRHVVGRVYLCGDGHAWYSTIPRRL